ncbi:MAG: ECF-type sigma factor [Nitrosopumilaceae archaeon]
MSLIQNSLENRKNDEQNFTGTKSAIEKRRHKVYLLNLQGFSNTEIAKEINVSLSTVEKDLHYMKYYCIKWTKEILDFGRGKPILDICNQIDLVQSELWKLYRTEKDVNTKKRILDSIVSNSIKKEKQVKDRYLSFNETELLEKFREETIENESLQ